MTVTTERPVRTPAKKVRWWKRPWIAPLMVIAIVFVAFSLPPYLSMAASQSRVPAPDGVAGHYAVLVGHVLFGSIALLTACLQIWPWFRQRYPAVHRVTGRIYVFAGVLPAGTLALYVGVNTPFGPVARVSNVLLALLWLACTVTGYRMALRRRYVQHRRWMIRSFALTASIITNRIWGVAMYLIFEPQLETTFDGNEQMLSWTIAGITTWLGWVTTLLVAEWWLERDVSRRRQPAR